ncbi:MAG: CoA transferase [Actinobacteria bacterium]|nr:CoA transferase [Actinomycetota bacterium]
MKIVELVGMGPGPLAAMVLADLGAEVIRVDRPGAGGERDAHLEMVNRNRRSVIVDMKAEGGPGVVVRLARSADALIDPFRPGVTERLGIGPEECMRGNPGLVYGRMTGWGQEGPLSQAAGHDINYIALAGPLAAIGRREGPVPPLNLVGDYGGGAMLLALGILAALIERGRSDRGQVVDAAMVDGAALISTLIISLAGRGAWSPEREANLLDGGAHFYDVYETADGRHVSIGAIEPPFYAELLELLGLDPGEWPQDPARWPELSERMAAVFKTRTRDEWVARLEGTDACFAPVLEFAEAPEHPHLKQRQTYVEAFGMVQPAPAPRFSRTPGQIASPPCVPGEHSREILSEWGFAATEIESLEAAGVTETGTRVESPSRGR